MIGSTGLGKGFGGLARYLFHGHDGKEPSRAAWTAVRNLAIQDPELAPQVMRATAEQNARVKTPVYHLSPSPHRPAKA